MKPEEQGQASGKSQAQSRDEEARRRKTSKVTPLSGGAPSVMETCTVKTPSVPLRPTSHTCVSCQRVGGPPPALEPPFLSLHINTLGNIFPCAVFFFLFLTDNVPPLFSGGQQRFCTLCCFSWQIFIVGSENHSFIE